MCEEKEALEGSAVSCRFIFNPDNVKVSGMPLTNNTTVALGPNGDILVPVAWWTVRLVRVRAQVSHLLQGHIKIERKVQIDFTTQRAH